MSMYKGFFRFGGVEVINVARTMAYIAAGYGAPGTVYDEPVAYDGLAEALGETYRTPVLDGAPWYDESDPATHGFAGVLPLTVTGLVGTTRATEVVENIGDGGVAQRARASSRTVYTSALLVADSSEALDAGLLWLTGVLHRTCDPDVLPYTGAPLEGFRVLPGPLGGHEDMDAPGVTAAVDRADPGWAAYGGSYHPDTGILAVTAQPGSTMTPLLDVDGGTPTGGGGGSLDLIDGGTPSGGGTGEDTDGDTGGATEDGGDPVGGDTYDSGYDGGGPSDEYDTGLDGGTAGGTAQPPYARLVAPVELTCLSRVVVTWTLTPVDDTPVFIQVGAADHLGVELHRDPPQLITGETTITWVWEQAAWDEWKPAVWVGAPGVEVAVTVARRPFMDPDACLSPLRRTYPQLTCVSGPTEVASWADDCDNKMMQVEWTLVAGDPHRYGDAVTLLGSLDVSFGGALSHAPGVSYGAPGTVPAASVECTEPVVTPTCGYNPDYPGFITPPAAPVVVDPGLVTPTDYHRRVITLDPSVIPDARTLAVRWTLTNNALTPVAGVRVRLWRQADPDFTIHDECAFDAEFWVNYIDAGAQLVVDGIAGTITAVCEDGSLAPASGVMRGPYRGAFDFPTLGCTGRYFIAVDAPYPTADLLVTIEAAPQEY